MVFVFFWPLDEQAPVFDFYPQSLDQLNIALHFMLVFVKRDSQIVEKSFSVDVFSKPGLDSCKGADKPALQRIRSGWGDAQIDVFAPEFSD